MSVLGWHGDRVGSAAAQDSRGAPVEETRFGSTLLSGGRCRLTAERRFEADRAYGYRGRMAVQYRKRGARRWRTLVVARSAKRTIPTARRVGFGRVQALIGLRRKPVPGLLAGGARFRAITVHRDRIDGRALRRESHLNTLRLKQCELGIPSRQIAAPKAGAPILVERGPAPRGGEFQLLASSFGRSALCVTVLVDEGSGGGCGFAAPKRRALGSGTFYDRCAATYSYGVVSTRVGRVLVRLGDGRVLRARLLRTPERLKRLKGRFFILALAGSIEVKVVRALGSNGRTLAVDRARIPPGGGSPGAPLPPPQGCRPSATG